MSNKESSYDYDDDELDEMEIEAKCISHLEGNRLLPIGKIINAVGNNMCCSRCALANHNAMMKEFINFCAAYEEKIEKTENEMIFYSKTERLEWCDSHSKSIRNCIPCSMELKGGGYN